MLAILRERKAYGERHMAYGEGRLLSWMTTFLTQQETSLRLTWSGLIQKSHTLTRLQTQVADLLDIVDIIAGSRGHSFELWLYILTG